MATVSTHPSAPNVAHIHIPFDWATGIVFEMITNSPTEQRVELRIDGDLHNVTGSGTEASLKTIPIPDGTRVMAARFTYGDKDAPKPSKLQVGGPYYLGTSRWMMIMAENGDDEDCNDVVLHIRGKGMKIRA